MNTDSPLDDLRPRIDKLLDFFTEPGKGEKYLKDLADDLEKLYELYCHKQVIEALERVDKEVDNTVVVLTKDLPSLLSLDHDLKIRKAHKDEIHKIIQEELAELRKTL